MEPEEVRMPTYISLGNFNSAEAYAGYVQRQAGLEELSRSLGGRLVARYLTQGQFDVVVIFEAPDDVAAAQHVLRAVARVPGGVRTQTLRAFTDEEAARIVQGLA
jgi:uncharacterized protein with GYD domain